MGRLVLALVVGSLLFGCGRNKAGGDDGLEVDASYTPDACEGLGCFIVDCASKGLPSTSISGTVYAPNGTLPLYGVNVYVPVNEPGPLPEGAQCDRCSAGPLGGAYTQTSTDEMGRFTLRDVPATTDVPVVIQVGKWRRQIKIPNIAACQDVPVDAADTRLPKNRMEGDIPKIAITTGNADALECLPRKLGVDDSEIGLPGTDQRIHLYAGNGRSSFAAGHPGGTGAIPSATTFWDNVDKLKPYDITFLSCEGSQRVATKPQAALDAMKAYADLGGRVFASHWHNIWISGQFPTAGPTPAVWSSIATWTDLGNIATATDIIDEVNSPKGMAYADWMVNVGGSTTRTQIPVTQPRRTATSVDLTKAERWVYLDNGGGQLLPQIFLFTTPNEMPPANRCGKVVFSDMHVSADSISTAAYPGGCSTNPMTPQEKALAFIFFDISSCVGPIF